MWKQSPSNLKSKEQILELIHQFQENEDKDCQEKIVKHYQYLVESIARKYSSGRSYYDDIYQVGMIGLLGAIRRFDSSFGRSFEAFAVPTIIGEIKRYLRDKTWDVHVPRRIKELGPKIKAAIEYLTTESQRSPLISEIAAYLEVEEEDVLEAMEMSRSYQALSMDRPVESGNDESSSTLFDIIGEEDNEFEKTDQRIIVKEAMKVLSEKEKNVIKLTYIEQLSQKEAGEILGISQMHVSRLQRGAIRKLQDAIASPS
ncbi:RNA polymerase sigma factor SigB [Rummeliibacillus sp. JY-2-4R]